VLPESGKAPSSAGASAQQSKREEIAQRRADNDVGVEIDGVAESAREGAKSCVLSHLMPSLAARRELNLRSTQHAIDGRQRIDGTLEMKSNVDDVQAVVGGAKELRVVGEAQRRRRSCRARWPRRSATDSTRILALRRRTRS
jgi:hypothetical protein